MAQAKSAAPSQDYLENSYYDQRNRRVNLYSFNDGADKFRVTKPDLGINQIFDNEIDATNFYNLQLKNSSPNGTGRRKNR